jgi:hypothetical protein
MIGLKEASVGANICYQSLAREDTNHTLSKKAKNETPLPRARLTCYDKFDWNKPRDSVALQHLPRC